MAKKSTKKSKSFGNIKLPNWALSLTVVLIAGVGAYFVYSSFAATPGQSVAKSTVSSWSFRNYVPSKTTFTLSPNSGPKGTKSTITASAYSFSKNDTIEINGFAYGSTNSLLDYTSKGRIIHINPVATLCKISKEKQYLGQQYCMDTKTGAVLSITVKDNTNKIIVQGLKFTVEAYDVAKPVITNFTLKNKVNSGDYASIGTIAGTDNVGIVGYLVTDTATPPAASAAGWKAPNVTGGWYPYYLAQTNSYFIPQVKGEKLLYPWAKDAAGNVSLVYSKPIKFNFTSTKVKYQYGWN